MFVAQSPFERLRFILADLEPGAPPVDLSVGAPTHAPPPFIAEVIARHSAGFLPYPPIAGTPSFQRAVHDWLDRRYGLGGWFRDVGAVLPLSGSREGLFLAVAVARDLLRKRDPAVLFANPFYQTYPSAAHVIGAEAVPMNAADGVLPDFGAIADATLDRAVAYYVGSPSNPAGLVASVADWHALFDRAERHDFFLFADECYSEIYREASGPPPGALQAARERPGALKRLIVFNSLSKRSNLAGMRVGFAAGDAAVMGAMKDLRNLVGPQVPAPLQEAAAAAYDDEAHVTENRALYDAKYAIAEELLAPLFGPVTPPGGFFLWLPVGDDVAFVRRMWSEAGVRLLPGRFLAAGEGEANVGNGFVRLALVSDEASARTSLSRIAAALAPSRAAARLSA